MASGAVCGALGHVAAIYEFVRGQSDWAAPLIIGAIAHAAILVSLFGSDRS